MKESNLEPLSEHQHKMLREAEQLIVTLSTTGWKTVIKPLLDRMINDCIGFKDEHGRWQAGAMQKENITPQTANVYSTALIEFETHIYDSIKIANNIKESRKPKKKEEEAPFSIPMKDTQYV